MAGSGLGIAIGIHINIFYSDTILLPLGFIALAIAAARSIDAITDPIMGWITDRTRSRWGRRRPWMFLAAPLAAVTIVCLFAPPATLTTTGAALWFAVMYTLLFVFVTMYSVPHYGLGAELTDDYHERSSLFAWLEAASVIGILAASYIPLQLADEDALGARDGFLVFALGFGGALWFFYWLLCFRVKERPDYYLRESNPLVPGVRRTLRNRPFRILLFSYLVGATTAGIPALLWPYYATYVLKLPLPQQGLLLAFVFGAAFLSIPLWVKVTRFQGKKAAYIVARLMAAGASFSLFFLGEGDLVPAAVLLSLFGFSYGGFTMLGPSIQADVIDYDEFHTGKRREAQYGALWSTMTKFTTLPGSAVPLGILATVGYQPNVDQTEAVLTTITVLYALAPAVTGLVSIAMFMSFPINEQTHAAVLDGIRRHKSGLSAVDPFTGVVVEPSSGDSPDGQEAWFLDHFSQRELNRVKQRGTNTLLRSIPFASICSIMIMIASVTVVVVRLDDMSTRPGVLEVLLILLAGGALTAAVYHGIRLRAAWNMHTRKETALAEDESHESAVRELHGHP
jgi:GPH family glycoside/pentoside/hexuronide:cation symporter